MCKKLLYLAFFVLTLGFAATSVGNAAEEGLVGLWRFDETSGTTAMDSSGNGNDGTLEGNPQWVTEGKIGGALSFDGQGDDRVTVQSFDVTGSGITLAAWINPVTFTNDSRMLSKAEQMWVEDHIWAMALSGSNEDNLQFRLRTDVGNTSSVTSSGSPVEAGEWTHVAVAWDASDPVMRLYKNGQEIHSVNIDITNVWSGNKEGNAVATVPDTHIGIGNQSVTAGEGGRRPFDGRMDDVRVYSKGLTAEEIQVVMKGIPGIPPGVAYDPSPANEATDVPRDVTLSWMAGDYADTHDVYLGTSFEDVNTADRAAPKDVLVSQGQSDTTYNAGRLELGQTYYWRIDEVNAPPTDDVIYPGDIWSFTTEPYSYPVDKNNITATASSAQPGMVAQNTVNGSGLAADDSHSTVANDMWLSSGIKPDWIHYEFDKIYKLDSMWVWNSNQQTEAFLGFGARDVTIEYSTDGATWTVLEGVPEFAQAPGAGTYTANTVVDFGGVVATFVKLTIDSNWMGIVPQTGLSEVRFFHLPVRAREPQPADGATVDPIVVLSWRAGREAAVHKVYVGVDANALSLAGEVTESSFDTDTASLDLLLDETYSWRVDEVNDAESPSDWTGDLWNFTTAPYSVVDDMESYDDEENLPWKTWADGYEVDGNGSLVGKDPMLGDFGPETDIVNNGDNSLPIWFDNSTAPLSEATRTFDPVQNWSRSAITTLVLYVYGDPTNTGGALYVNINGKRVDSTLDLTKPIWMQWNIDLASLDVNLSNVTEMVIGISGQGLGPVYVDDIRLYREAPPLPTEEVWVEAESATSITEPMEIKMDDIATSGGACIGTDSTDGDSIFGKPDNGIATIPFSVQGGTYKILFRVSIPATDDSLWVRVQGATTQTTNHSSGWIQMNGIDVGLDWHWVEIFSDDDEGNPTVLFTMPAGTYNLEVAKREAGVRLDAVLISKVD